ncbi:MAG TPA: L-serine ammonia-lyase [Gammaproteobacteria bacterium]|nr:L-serine ammonia-lyase [Gammaproteobacteria bacterium]
MTISIFDLIKIGVGPSSSHTMGPMLAARQFLLDTREAGVFDRIERVGAQLYGSLALTGKGHCTDRAILLGFEGEVPQTFEPQTVEARLERIRGKGRLRLLDEREIDFDEPMELLFHKNQILPRHANGMRFTAFDADGEELHRATFYSIGGGFIVRGDDAEGAGVSTVAVPFPFDTGNELLELCRQNGMRIYELVLANEGAWRTADETRATLLDLWRVMKECVREGFAADGVLPGVLKVPRRAPRLYRELCGDGAAGDFMDWVNAYALAVNEVNAAGGRIVTAPTNGAAGIIPAVLHYYRRFVSGADEEGVIRFLLTAGAIAILYKKNASISGAEMGCQGEVGVACSMAAGGLVAAIGGSNAQVENAAEIGMEHNLGLTCDPIAGLVQIPCIERNAMGAVKAINAARMAFRGDGSHKVSLDQVIATMRQTGLDMSTSYKETSQGGLAVNVPEC